MSNQTEAEKEFIKGMEKILNDSEKLRRRINNFWKKHGESLKGKPLGKALPDAFKPVCTLINTVYSTYPTLRQDTLD